MQQKWQGKFWQAQSKGVVNVECRNCRSFDANHKQCSIGFGTPLRKCVVSSIEAHFNDCKNREVLEIGFGRFMLARNLIRKSGGRWTGIEPQVNPNNIPVLGKGGHGDAANIPFPDQTFDMAFGIQSIEHWAQKVGGRTPSAYKTCFAEISRVLKPGGTIYFDAPIYFHGHAMFVAGKLQDIRKCFDDSIWQDVRIEKWRENFAPLEQYPPSDTVVNGDWPIELDDNELQELLEKREDLSVYMIAITATKR
ncbi:MAG: class I SAM-dependent methyltransferase [Gammaproteobacteria bacterium]|nr:class I SAM-dependent methyltransferase [Gammaproteobacteria bacterium]NNM12318.1 class I SAM-dependent methyltransferase [Pseudomonadales bacterium]